MDESPRAVLRGGGGRYHPTSLQSKHGITNTGIAVLALVSLGVDRRVCRRFLSYLENKIPPELRDGR